jgi:hypothetical protein
MAYLPPILRKKWFCVLMLAAAFLAFAGIFLLPEVVSTAWHLVHENSARFRVLEIPVPDGWWAFTSKGTLIVQKMERSTNQDSEVIVNDLPLPAGEVYDYDKEKTLSVKRMLKEGYRLQEERMSHMAGEDCFCLFFSDVRDKTPPIQQTTIASILPPATPTPPPGMWAGGPGNRILVTDSHRSNEPTLAQIRIKITRRVPRVRFAYPGLGVVFS